jgi:hypothetical protein
MGTCYGFAIHSEATFAFLRGGQGDRLDVTASTDPTGRGRGELVMEWVPDGDVALEARLHRIPGGYELWIADAGWFEIDIERRRVILPDQADPIRREERLWSIPAILLLLERGDLGLHAAAVQVGDGAVILAAPRTGGKTTLAAGFVDAGHRLLSEDVTCIRPSRPPAVIPGPAMLRIRRDVAASLAIRHATTIGPADDRAHVAIDPAGRGDCEPVPLRAIVFLRPSDADIELRRTTATAAIRDLWSLGSMLPSRFGRARAFEGFADVVSQVPVYDLYRPMRLDALPRTVELIRDAVGG